MKHAQEPDDRLPARRRFLWQSLAVLGAPAMLSAWSSQALARGLAGGSGSVSINVRDKGARGDGQTDDTSAFQAAIDALPGGGGTVTVPAGTYMIDASRAINLRSNMRLQMDPQAQLTAIPNSIKRYHVVKVWSATNVEISGGRIVGERDAHGDTVGEWGYGLNITASTHVTVSDLHISNCWGDGIWIGALGRGDAAVVSSDVTLDRVVSTNNRRQGLSIGPVRGVTIKNSTFSGSNGTAPQAGIDLEPQGQGIARDVTIDGCIITGNKGTGLEMHANVDGVIIRNCDIHDNDGYGVLSVGSGNLTITGNTITSNGLVGLVMAKDTHDVTITGNTLTSNSSRRIKRALKALMALSVGDYPSELQVDGSTSNVRVSGNTFSP
jgi:parallel beta-helix repeat protein